MEYKIQRPDIKDAKSIYTLVKDSQVLDVNSEYLYLLQCSHFRDYCAVAKSDGEVLGFVSGYKLPQDENILFIWQVCVDPKAKGQGLAKKMMMDIIGRDFSLPIITIHTTISPSNIASQRAFEKLAKGLNASIKKMTMFEKKDFIDAHEEEILFEIGPFTPQIKEL